MEAVMEGPAVKRADGRRNYERLLAVARVVVQEQGTQASLRDIARRAEVGLGTLYRHFPTRDALLEVLLREGFDRLATRGQELDGGAKPGENLLVWVGEFGRGSMAYRGLPASLLEMLADETSPLHQSCVAMRNAGAGLLRRAQDAGAVRPDLTATELFELVAAVGWVAEQSADPARRRERLLTLVTEGLAR
jgi:AcrR family transcriptional regulator